MLIKQYSYSLAYLLILITSFLFLHQTLYPQINFNLNPQLLIQIQASIKSQKININLSNIKNYHQIISKITHFIHQNNYHHYFTIASPNQTISVSFNQQQIFWHLNSIPLNQTTVNNATLYKLYNTIHSIFQSQIQIGKIFFIKNFWIQEKKQVSQNIIKIIRFMRIPNQFVRWSVKKLWVTQLQQNSRNKLDSIQQVFRLTEGLSIFNECGYSDKKCRDINIINILNIDQFQRRGIFKKEDNLIVYGQCDDEIEISILESLGLKFNSFENEVVSIFYRIEYLKILKNVIQQYNYLREIEKKRHQLVVTVQSNQLIQSWKQSIKKIIHYYQLSQYQQIWKFIPQKTQIIHDPRIVQINIFPSDYKIGIYLPLIVPLFYPLIYILKSIISNS